MDSDQQPRFIIRRLPIGDVFPRYRTPNGGWANSREKAEHFDTREEAQSILDEHDWGRDGHEIEEVQ